jgi:hypothetical protein
MTITPEEVYEIASSVVASRPAALDSSGLSRHFLDGRVKSPVE